MKYFFSTRRFKEASLDVTYISVCVCVCIYIFLGGGQGHNSPLVGQGFLIHKVSRSDTTTHFSL
jgi:hypothetical protein